MPMYLYSQACISRAPSIARLRWQQLRAGVHLALADNKLGTGGGRAGFIAQTAAACSVWPDLHARFWWAPRLTLSAAVVLALARSSNIDYELGLGQIQRTFLLAGA